MTPDQMAELAARLHVAADSQREYSQSVESLDWAADLDRAADLIAGMAQRVPLTDEQIVAAFGYSQNEMQFREAFAWGVAFAERHHGIRSEE